MIDLTKPVQLRNGMPARIASTNGGGMFPLLSIYTASDGRDYPIRHTLAGSAMGAPGESQNDLVNIPDHRDEVAYVNLGGSFSNKAAAQREHGGWPVIELKLQVGTERGLEDVRKVLSAEVARA